MNNQIDKSKEVISTVELINNKLNFKGTVGDNTPISIDYFPPYGDGLGYTSLELFLLSLSSCLGSSLSLILGKMGKPLTKLSIDSHGYRRTEHPTGFHKIELKIYLSNPNLSDVEVEKAIKISEDSLCPLLSMIKGNVEVVITYVLN